MSGEHRKGLTYSAVMHLVLMFFVLFGLPSFLQPEIPPQPLVIAVEVLPITQMTNIKPIDEPLAKEEKPAPPKPESTLPKPQETPPSPAPPEPPKEALPLPEPNKEEKKPDPKKEEVKKPDPKREKTKKQEKSLDDILKNLKRENQVKQADEPKEKPKDDAGAKMKAKNTTYDTSMPMSMSEIDAIRSQITRCWNVPAGAKNADQLQVTLRVQLAQDGTVAQVELADESKGRYSADSFYRAASDSAMRAVRQCSPLKNLPPEKYQTWRDMLLTFDPKEMLF